jgi:hypothetical protein
MSLCCPFASLFDTSKGHFSQFLTPKGTRFCTFLLNPFVPHSGFVARRRGLAPLALFKCAPGRTAFRRNSLARIESLPHRGSLIGAWFFFFHGALKRRSFSGKGLKARSLIKNGFIA